MSDPPSSKRNAPDAAVIMKPAKPDKRVAEIAETFDALQRFQDRDRGLWHLVIDEPGTRVESSANGAFIYCHDRLREMGMIAPKHGEMIERAFTGLKRLYYRGGLAATCRGTGMGVPEYYRPRPMGYYGNSLFNAAMAPRR
ncbi:MAG: glycoside hydrolase family 88 protein [Verrucomicrobia bacterium]|nr:glycoside hydrolase family 88 protein [Verrucomicrobiota bacterium]